MKNTIELYDALVASRPNIERKGKTTPYTSVNGHMFSFLSKEGQMGLRLSALDREYFISHFESKLMEQHGRTMKEYVLVPAALMSNVNLLTKFLDKSFEYVSGLKPKLSKKR